MMRMHTKIFLTGMFLLAVASLARASEPEVLEVEMPGEPGNRRLVITVLSGTLNITGTDGDQLRLVAAPEEKATASLEDLEDDPRAQGLSKLTGVATQMLVRDRDGVAEVEIGSQLLQSDGVVLTDMAIELPRDVELDITAQYAQEIQITGMSGAVSVRSTDAAVTVTSATGPLKIQTASGWIRLYEITGPVEANTSFGGIEAVLSEVSPDKPVWLTAAVGPVDVALPGAADATMTLGSTWGEIYSDFDLTLERAPADVAKLAPPPETPSVPRRANAVDPENVVLHGEVPAPPAAASQPSPPEKRGRTETDSAEAEAATPAEGASTMGKAPQAEKKTKASSVERSAVAAPPAPPQVKRFVGRIGTGKADIRIQTGTKNIYIRRAEEKKADRK